MLTIAQVEIYLSDAYKALDTAARSLEYSKTNPDSSSTVRHQDLIKLQKTIDYWKDELFNLKNDSEGIVYNQPDFGYE